MKKKLGAITIGQSPRSDVVPEIIPYLGDNVEVIEAGALDGLTYEEIQEFAPREGDYILVSTLRDGRSVRFAERYILPRLQDCIDKLEAEGADVILFICTGVFPNIFKSTKPIIYPQKVLHSCTPYLLGNGKLAIIIPEETQIQQCKKKWNESLGNVEVVNGSPYKEKDEIKKAIEKLNLLSDIDIIVMDCIGYNQEMKEMVVKGTNKPVILARTLVARVLGEILN